MHGVRSPGLCGSASKLIQIRRVCAYLHQILWKFFSLEFLVKTGGSLIVEFSVIIFLGREIFQNSLNWELHKLWILVWSEKRWTRKWSQVFEGFLFKISGAFNPHLYLPTSDCGSFLEMPKFAATSASMLQQITLSLYVHLCKTLHRIW